MKIMKIEDDKVVGIHYKLTDNDGKVLDTSEDREPLYYLHGYGNIIPGLEDELEGKAINEKFQVKVQPEDGYGEYNKEMVYVIERSKFPDPRNIEIGMSFTSNAQGQHITLNVVDIQGDNITLDANHPLAGKELNFDVEVIDIRTASKEEIQHGHVHGPGGHHH